MEEVKEKVRQAMYMAIEKFGLSSMEALKASEELDVVIVMEVNNEKYQSQRRINTSEF